MTDTRAALDFAPTHFECDECGHSTAVEKRTWHGGVGGWEFCEACALAAANRDAEGPDPMDGVEFPFAENH